MANVLNFGLFNTKTQQESGSWLHVKLPTGQLAYLETNDKGEQSKPCRIKTLGASSNAFTMAAVRRSRAEKAISTDSEIAEKIKKDGFNLETASEEEIAFAFAKLAENKTVKAALLTVEMDNIVLPADVAKSIGVKISKSGHVVIDVDNLIAFYSAFNVMERQVIEHAESEVNFILA